MKRTNDFFFFFFCSIKGKRKGKFSTLLYVVDSYMKRSSLGSVMYIILVLGTLDILKTPTNWSFLHRPFFRYQYIFKASYSTWSFLGSLHKRKSLIPFVRLPGVSFIVESFLCVFFFFIILLLSGYCRWS